MQSIQFFNLLKDKYTPEQLKILLPALRQDGLIYHGLQLPGVMEKVFETFSGRDIPIFPGRLVLASLYPELVKNHYPQTRPSASLLEKWMVEFEAFKQEPSEPTSLTDALDLALAIAEKRKILSSWGKLFNEMFTSKKGIDLFKIWKTPITLCSQLVENPEEMLAELKNPAAGMDQHNLWLTCILCNPIERDEKKKAILEGIMSFCENDQLEAVRFLQITMGNDFSKQIAHALVEDYSGCGTEFDLNETQLKTKARSLSQVERQTLRALISQAAGENESGLKWVRSAKKAIENYLTNLQITEIALMQQLGFSDEVQNKAKLLYSCESNQYEESDELLMAMEKTISSFDSGDEKKKKSPLADLFEAKSIQSAGNGVLARELASSAYWKMVESRDESGEKQDQQLAMNWSDEKLLDDLLSYNLTREASDLASRLLQRNPADEALMAKAGSLLVQNGQMDDALEVFQTLEILHPEDLQVKRSMGLALESVNDPDDAFKSWQDVVEKSEQPCENDLVHLADSASKIGNWDVAIDAAMKIPAESKMLGKAKAIIGSGYQCKGNTVLAEQYLSQAVELAVTDPTPWILLSDIYSANQDSQLAVETLRAAKAAFPESAEISYRLASCLNDQGAVSEAMGVISGVIHQNPDYLEGQLLNVKLMKSLHLDDSDEQIEILSKRFPEDPEVNFLSGSILVQKGRHEEAIAVLEKAANSSTAKPEWKAALADALAGEDYQTVKREVTQNAVEKAADILQSMQAGGELNTQSTIVQAEIDLRQGKHEEAYERLSNLNQEQKSLPTEWYWRIQAGIARAAAATGKFEIALASIQEAIEDQPDWVGLRKILAEIYQAAGRIEDALEAANQVMTIAPEIVENVLWFVSFLQKIGKVEEAEKVLEEAIQKDPQEKKYVLDLAEIYAGQGQNEKAIHLLNGQAELAGSLEDKELIYQAAVVYLKLDDNKAVLDCLSRRYALDLNSVEAGIDLAGFYSQNGEKEKAIELLEELTGKFSSSMNIQLLTAAELVHNGQLQDAMVLLSQISDTRSTPQKSIFIPDYWNQNLEQKDPVATLASQVAYCTGDFKAVIQYSEKIVKNEPENEKAIFLKRMAQRAMGMGMENTLPEMKNPDQLCQESSITLVVIETLEKEDESELAALYSRLQQVSTDSGLLGALNSIIAANEGNVIEAEAAFSDCKPYQVNENSILKAEEVIKLSVLVYAAAKVQHWETALSLARTLWKAQPVNLDLTVLYLSMVAQAKEMKQISQNIGLKIHAAADSDLECSAKDLALIDEQNGPVNDERYKRWMTRCRLAFQPNQSNLKMMALFSPRADDVKAMMTALHSNNQDHTAIQVAKKFNADPTVQYVLAVCQATKDSAEALNTLTHSLQNTEAQPTAWMMKSILEEMQNQKQDAIDSCETALSYWPDETRWQVKAADLWEAAGDLGNSLAHLETAFDQEPNNSEIKLKMGKVYSQLGLHEKSIHVLEDAAVKDSNTSSLWEALADAHYRAGDAENAEKAASKASEVDPFSIKPYLLTGKIAFENNDLSKALEQARLAISRNEKNSEAITFLAKILLKKGEKTQALAALEKAAACQDATLETMIQHANLVKEIKGPSNSKAILEKLVERYPENLTLLRILIEAQNECGDRVQAEETARRSLKIQSDQPDLHYSLGMIKMEHGDLDQAIYHFGQAIALDNQMSAAYLQLANVYQKQRNYHQALETLQQAIHTKPRDPQAYVAAAGIMRDSKDYQGAEKMLRKAVDIAPGDLNIKRQLGAVIALNLVHNSQQASSQL